MFASKLGFRNRVFYHDRYYKNDDEVVAFYKKNDKNHKFMSLYLHENEVYCFSEIVSIYKSAPVLCEFTTF